MSFMKVRINFQGSSRRRLRFAHCFFRLKWNVPNAHRIASCQARVSHRTTRVLVGRSLIGLDRFSQSAGRSLTPEIPAPQKLVVCFDVIRVTPGHSLLVFATQLKPQAGRSVVRDYILNSKDVSDGTVVSVARPEDAAVYRAHQSDVDTHPLAALE